MPPPPKKRHEHKQNKTKTLKHNNHYQSKIYHKSNTLLEINNQSAIFINQPIKIKIDR